MDFKINLCMYCYAREGLDACTYMICWVKEGGRGDNGKMVGRRQTFPEVPLVFPPLFFAAYYYYPLLLIYTLLYQTSGHKSEGLYT